MRARVLALSLLVAIGSLAPLAGALAPGPSVHACWGPTVEPSEDGGEHVDLDCSDDALRPGTYGSGCTLGFVLTDGTDLYMTTAGHCGPVGKRWHVGGLGWIGTTVDRVQTSNLLGMEDWALVEIDDEDRDLVDPTMRRFGGPLTPVPGVDTRAPVPGETVLQYGHGRGLGEEPATRGRAGPVLASTDTWFAYAGSVGPGDSGSPVRYATGEPAGIAVVVLGVTRTEDGTPPDEVCANRLDGDAQLACAPVEELCRELDGACDALYHEGGIHGIVLTTRMDAAIDRFEDALGEELTVVDGHPPGPPIQTG